MKKITESSQLWLVRQKKNLQNGELVVRTSSLKVKNTVSEWHGVAKKLGISKAEQDRISKAFVQSK